YTVIPKVYVRNLITRLKLMAGMNITESRLPQDGAIKGRFGDKDLDMRVSCLPTNEGEKIVIRILDYTRSLNGIEKLGFNNENFKKLQNMIAAPNGIILITGATGSGKSTTSYSILQVLNKEKTNIITVEDPIEMNIEGLNQVQVNSEIGLNFATVLRSILRQDPNVILIGEIRDSETAKIAIRASITGHLVISTLHTNNSLSTIERLLDMDVERYLLSTALTGIISQRLAKTICPHCHIERETTPYEKKVFKLGLRKDVDKIFDANPNGCEHCNKGYRGRIAIQEVLEIDDDIRNALNDENVEKEDIKRLVYGSGNVITLLQDGLQKVLDGYTTFEEIYRIIEIDNDINDCYYEPLDDESNLDNKDQLKKQREQELNELKHLQDNMNNDILPASPEIPSEEPKENKALEQIKKEVIEENDILPPPPKISVNKPQVTSIINNTIQTDVTTPPIENVTEVTLSNGEITNNNIESPISEIPNEENNDKVVVDDDNLLPPMDDNSNIQIENEVNQEEQSIVPQDFNINSNNNIIEVQNNNNLETNPLIPQINNSNN
ncbi:MAG: Flp pilus assembly complex ATPase component TadA, partial [Bacilli bacterium]|nr:Flp pilus assembly complex ATPase component TadA [Bacilli bacterium]